MRPLLHPHRDELARNKTLMQLSPNREACRALENTGALWKKPLTARRSEMAAAVPYVPMMAANWIASDMQKLTLLGE